MTGADPAYVAAAQRLGMLMADHSIRLVYGGARIGLMGALADAVLAGGGEVTGIIPEHLDAREVGHRGITELRIVESMHERKKLMFEVADAFAILPGGLGTLDETFEMITWRQLRLHDKPILLVNIEGYWEPFLQLVDHVIENGFARPAIRRLFTVVNSVDQVVAALVREPEPTIPDAPQERL
jgi:uncharacterized protein (TIGR00730 family)